MSKVVFYTVMEVADRWRLSEQTIRKMVKDGSLRAVRLSDSIRIPREEVERQEGFVERVVL